MSDSQTSRFAQATAVTHGGGGRWLAEIDLAWSAEIGPNGGYVAGLVVRALEDELNPDVERRLRSLTCHFLRPPAAGELGLEVEVLREGRRLLRAAVSATQQDRLVLRALAAYAAPDLVAGPQWAPQPPEVAPSPSRDASRLAVGEYRLDAPQWLGLRGGGPNIGDQLLFAPRLGHGAFAGTSVEAGEVTLTGGWLLCPEPQPVDAAWTALCADAWWPPVLEVVSEPMPVPTIDLTIHIRADLGRRGLPDQPILGTYVSRAAIGGLVEEDATLFLADGTLLAQARQLALAGV